jgi:uncharacterized protein YpmB
MNYKKIIIGVLIVAIVSGLIYYFYNKAQEAKEQEIINQAVDEGLKAGDSLLAKFDGVKVYDTRNDLAVFKTVNKNIWVGTLKDNYSNENFYEISTPSRTTGLIVTKLSVKKA